ncbi:MAG: hypothetical protein ACRD0P_07125 [Stackebrandtia sp.]
MTLPPQPGQPEDPQQQPNPYQPPQQYSVDPPTSPPGYGQPPNAQPGYGQPHNEQPSNQFQQPPDPQAGYAQPGPPTGQFQAQPGPPTGQFQPYGQQPQSFQDKVRAMPPNKLGMFAGMGGGGLLLLIIIIVIVSSGGGPSSVVDDYLSAVADGDLIEAQEYMCDPGEIITEEDMEKHQDDIDKMIDGMDWEITNEHVAGNEATVEVKITGSEEVAGEEKLKLELREGDWFICSGSSSLGY